ncbi:MAG: hypothetical protein M9945_12655 [Aquamicrobium sp.]|uniref:hypothetical protein n=1 Tax=Aquamicrobium sp. TaxID=1872579 RepID=UPI00349E7E99|nr:hypothetical protein [Aquamicrobium sp.]
MANWWENDPVVDDAAPASGGRKWWEADPVVQEAAPQQAERPEAGGYGSQIFSGMLEGATGLLGAPVDMMNNFVVSPAMQGVNAVFGTDFQPSQEPLGGSAGLRRGLAIAPESDQTGHQFARRVGQSVGGAVLPAAAGAGSLGQFAAGIGTAAAGGLGGAAAQQMFPDNIGAEIAGEMLGGLGAGAAISGFANRSARLSAERAVPTVEDLRTQASQLYDAAEARGVVASPDDTTALATRIRQIARTNELITPTGRVSGAYPRASEAMNLLDDYAGYSMNPTQMQVIRDTLADARNATEGKERRIASMMLDAFDEFTTPLAPELQQARAISQRAIKGRQLETLREVADTRKGDHALSAAYADLHRRIIRGEDGGWSPEQQAAIKRAATGTTASRLAERFGKFAPRGVVSTGLSAGVPYMIGNSFGGPGLGATLSAATMGTGLAAREAANHISKRSASIAELLARNGSQIVPQTSEAIRQRVVEALLAAQAAQMNERSAPLELTVTPGRRRQ